MVSRVWESPWSTSQSRGDPTGFWYAWVLQTQATPQEYSNPIHLHLRCTCFHNQRDNLEVPQLPEQAKFGGAAAPGTNAAIWRSNAAPGTNTIWRLDTSIRANTRSASPAHKTLFEEQRQPLEQTPAEIWLSIRATQFEEAAPTPEQTPFGRSNTSPRTNTVWRYKAGLPFESPTQINFAGTSPYQHHTGFGQGGTQPQAPVQEAAQVVAALLLITNAWCRKL